MEKMQISDGMEGGGAQRFITRLLLNLLMNTSIFDRPLGDEAGDHTTTLSPLNKKKTKKKNIYIF